MIRLMSGLITSVKMQSESPYTYTYTSNMYYLMHHIMTIVLPMCLCVYLGLYAFLIIIARYGNRRRKSHISICEIITDPQTTKLSSIASSENMTPPTHKIMKWEIK